MKVLITVLALVACVAADWAPKTVAEINEIRDECTKEHPLSDDYINQMKSFVYPNEEPVRQYIMCSALKMDIFCKEHGYNADRVAKQFKLDLEESEILAIAEDCVAKNPKVEGQSADAWAFKGHICLMSSKVGDKIKAFIKKRQEAAKAQ